jgi:hypothetical protein
MMTAMHVPLLHFINQKNTSGSHGIPREQLTHRPDKIQQAPLKRR